jgi:hypothetical protein
MPLRALEFSNSPQGFPMSAISSPTRSSLSNRSDFSAAAPVPLGKRISWPAVAAGTVIALAVPLLLAMLGATVGAAAVPTLAAAASDQLGKAVIRDDRLHQGAMQRLLQTGKPGAENTAADVVAAYSESVGDQDYAALLSRLIAGAASQVDRDAWTDIVMARAVISREDAGQRVQSVESTANAVSEKAAQATEDAKQEARKVGDATARVVSRAMVLAFAVFAIGGSIAWWGGSVGQRRSAVAE